MIFPFTAIVGQDEMKTALILNVIDPAVGGLLIMGERERPRARRCAPWPSCFQKRKR